MKNDSKVDRLNATTQGLPGCAWPGCTDRHFLPATIRGTVVELRVGALCLNHAEEVADAVLEQRVRIADFAHHDFTKQSAEQRNREEADEKRRRDDTKRRRGQPGWVYYLQVGDRIKVGYSADLRRRLKSYPPGSDLLAVEPGTPDLERQRHTDFRQYLIAGREWFRPSDELLNHVKTLVDMHGKPSRFAHSYRTPGQQPLKPAAWR